MQKEVLSSETKSLKTLQISIGFASRTYCSLLCAGTFWNVDDYWHQKVNNNIDKSCGPKSTPTKVFISQRNIAPNYLRCYNEKRPCIAIQDYPEHLSGSQPDMLGDLTHVVRLNWQDWAGHSSYVVKWPRNAASLVIWIMSGDTNCIEWYN